MELSHTIKVLGLLVGIFFCSTAVIFIKASAIDPILLSGLRLTVAVVFLFPLFVRDQRREGLRLKECMKISWIPGILLGIHFMSWLTAARMTGAANAALIVNLVPVVMPLIIYLMLRERVNRFEVLGTIIAMMGTAVLFGADFHISPDYFWGDLICFGSMIFFAVYLALGRKKRSHSSIWLYVLPIYSVAAVFCLFCSFWVVNPLAEPWSKREFLLLMGLGLLPTVLGHSLLNWGITHLRGQVVGILNMGQFVFAGMMAYMFFGEIPSWEFYLASTLVVAGGALAMKDSRKGKNFEG